MCSPNTLKSPELASSLHQAMTPAPARAARGDRARTGFEAGLRRSRRAGHSRRPPGAPAKQAARAGRAGGSQRAHGGDLVVHIDHGIGRFVGLQTIEAAGAPHDCLESTSRGRPAVFARRKTRAAFALRLRDGRARQARPAAAGRRARRGEEARARNGGRTDSRRRRAHDPRRPAAHRAGGALRRILRPVSLRRDAGPGERHRSHARRPRRGPSDGPARLRRRRLRQDRGRVARRLRRGDQRQADRDRRADDAARAPAHEDFRERFSGLPVRIGQLSRMVPRPKAARPRKPSLRAASTSSSAPTPCSARA